MVVLEEESTPFRFDDLYGYWADPNVPLNKGIHGALLIGLHDVRRRELNCRFLECFDLFLWSTALGHVQFGPGPYRPSDVLSIGGVSVAGDAFDGAIMRHDLSKHFGAGVEYRIPFGSNILSMPIHVMEKLCSPADIGFLVKKEIMDFLRNVKSWVVETKDQAKLTRLLQLVEEQLGFYVFEQIEGAKRKLSESEKEIFGDTENPERTIEKWIGKIRKELEKAK